jgi:hypothetical protein
MIKNRHIFMRRQALCWSCLLVLLVTLISSSAQAIVVGHAWVGPSGSNDTGCGSSRETPCRTIAYAYAQTGPGGQITCIDSSSAFTTDTLTITHSITIDCQGLTLSAAGSTLITINAGPTDAVILRGIDFESFILPGGYPGVGGISFTGGGALHVQNCIFRNFTNNGIKFAPSGGSRLFISDSIFQHNGGASTGGAIVVQPSGAGSARVELNQVRLENNTFGIAVDGTGSTGGINMTIADSVLSGNSHDGIIATTPSGGAPIGVMVTNTRSVNNAFGIRSLGPNVTVRANNSDIVGNVTGLSFSGGAALLTFGNNRVRANATDGVFSGPVALQ